MRLLAALRRSYGIVSYACEAVGCSRKTFYQYYKSDEKFKQAADETEDAGIDHAVKQLHKNIDKGKEASLIFYLKCRGRRRGYNERGEDTQMIINITSSSEITPDDLI